MPTAFFGPNQTKAQTMQELYKDLTVNKEGSFEVEFPPAGSPEAASANENTRVALLTMLRNGLAAINAPDGKSLLRDSYPTPTMPSPFFDEHDMNEVLASANMLLNPRDPYFVMSVTDGEIGAIRMFGDVINMVARYGDSSAVFTLLRMFVRPVKEEQDMKAITELPFDTRKETLLRRRNSILAVSFRADNTFLLPQLMKRFAQEEDSKMLMGVVNAFEQNAERLKLSELQRSRWMFVLLNNMNIWKGDMTPDIRERLTALVLGFNSAQKPEEIATKIDQFVDVINPLPQEGQPQGQSQTPAAPSV